MKRFTLFSAIGLLTLLTACANVPEQYDIVATTEGGPATVEVTVDGVATTMEIADGESWTQEYTTPEPPFSINVSVTAESSNEDQMVSCGVFDPAADDQELANATGPSGTTITCSIDVD